VNWKVLYFLGHIIRASGGAEEASRARARRAWAKFRELYPILTSRGVSQNLKGKVIKIMCREWWYVAVKLCKLCQNTRRDWRERRVDSWMDG